MFRRSEYRTRSAERDLETDDSRLGKIIRLLDNIITEIRNERDGLNNRYKKETADAGFLLAAIDNEGVNEKSDMRIDQLTGSILRSERRLVTLANQADTLSEIRSDLVKRFSERDGSSE